MGSIRAVHTSARLNSHTRQYFRLTMSLRHVDPKQRVAVITGCSEPNSLGAAFARELLGRKWTVFATARSLSTLDNLRDIGCHVSAAHQGNSAPAHLLHPVTDSGHLG